MREMTTHISAFIGFCLIGVLYWSSTLSFFVSTAATTSSTVTVYSDLQQDNLLALKQQEQLLLKHPAGKILIHSVVQDEVQQLQYLVAYCGPSSRDRWNEFVRNDLSHLATELWKFCVLKQPTKSHQAVAYLNLGSPFVTPLHNLLKRGKSTAILGDSYLSGTIHGSVLILQPQHHSIASHMFQLLLETSVELLAGNHMLIPRTLYALISSSHQQQNAATKTPQPLYFGLSSDWYLLQLSCVMSAHPTNDEEFRWDYANSRRLAHHCPDEIGFCCSVLDKDHQVVQMTRHPVFPLPKENSLFPLPFNWHTSHFKEQDLPFISTVREVFLHQNLHSTGTGLFDELLRNNCFPSEPCNDCLRDNADGCEVCAVECSCYCRTLCQYQATPTITVVKRLVVSPPVYTRMDPNRLVPRMIHQFVLDEMDTNGGVYWYPDTSRTVKSVATSGWEYRPYLPEDMERFLVTHFPVEVVQAFQSLATSAESLRLDLFRYCVLLIHGGVFVNTDVLLESNLDAVIDADIGFMVPTDNQTDGCLWQGFLAAAPGHPFLAKAVENIVNQVRNRFTLVDMDATLCPKPRLFLNRIDKTSSLTGSCLLAKSVKWALSQSPDTIFSPGDLVAEDNIRLRSRVPGRVVVLRGNRDDMGGHRLTYEAKNSVVAQVDLPVVDEQPRIDDAKNLGARYDYDALYVPNLDRADEAIEIIVESPSISQV